MPGSFSWGDMYGGTGPGSETVPGDVSPPVSQAASGKVASGDKTPAWSWLTLVVVLFAVRILWEMGG